MILYIILGAVTIAVVIAAMVMLSRANKFETDFGLPPESTSSQAEESPAAQPAPAPAQPQEPPAAQPAGAPAQPEEQFAWVGSLNDAKPGDEVSIGGHRYRLSKIGRYASGSSTWFSAETADEAGGTYYLSWGDGDVSLDQEIDPNALGVSADLLDQFAEQEEGSLELEGGAYHLVEAGEAMFHERDGASGEPVRYWDFQNDDGTQVVSVEVWDDGEIEASAGICIDQSSIEIFRRSE